MTDPVIDPEGNSFEREAIERWLRTHNTSPITRSRLTPDRLAANRALREAIEEWSAANAAPTPEPTPDGTADDAIAHPLTDDAADIA
eukprot:CAMPEP_0172194276 /NCGR_PEP_ID=MMETSP1050-20130122/25480_1 /TAXON_ID=233186 /ORGANISM="Cryptomonas curvata, Strain CCAP979/52" /LENGTH=86 /DNA_ID=CAMNT_0012870045 /DNA_START=239 /DNA_END=495 /DNA_ORIENTATION=+